MKKYRSVLQKMSRAAFLFYLFSLILSALMLLAAFTALLHIGNGGENALRLLTDAHELYSSVPAVVLLGSIGSALLEERSTKGR